METTDNSAQNTGAEQNILSYIEEKRQDNRQKAKKNALHTLIGAAVWTAATVLFPPAGIGGFVAAAGILYGSYFGWDLITNRGIENSLVKAKSEAAEDPSFAKTLNRAATERKWHDCYDNLLLGAALTGSAAILTMAFAPLTVAAALAAPVFLAATTVGIASGVMANLAKGGYKAANSVARVGTGIFFSKKMAALDEEAAKLKGASPANAPSPTASFDKAANSNEPPKPEAKEPAPVIKPEAPKL